MELSDIQRERLHRAANIAANASWEGDISGLAFAMLRYAGLDIENGYLITSENHVSNGKPDIMVEVLVGRRKILIIECKKDTSHPTRSKQQLEGYMQDGVFPHGILMYPRNSIFFSLDIEEDDAEVQVGLTYNNVTDFEEMINAMAQMRIPELEAF
ncbi:hypothetical protein INT43_004984 [Umbelopsis isabellina]|uniref:Uncharacterized protein n=1 Tax=Mortierella isabellina TaxID=91625 RepID=A0A8H7PEH2_MORIS|nr:hypothetical protein INT43_004984 [Umbelopsis isabellina]